MELTPTQKFLADSLRHVSCAQLIAMPSNEGSGVFLMNDTESGMQFWFTSQQRDEELARRASARGHLA